MNLHRIVLHGPGSADAAPLRLTLATGALLATLLVTGAVIWFIGQTPRAPWPAPAFGALPGNAALAAQAAGIATTLSQQPIAFEPADDHIPASGRYLSRGPGYALLLDPSGPALQLREPPPDGRLAWVLRLLRDRWFPQAGGARRLALQLPGAAPLHWQALESLPGESNYFDGNDPQRWRTGVPHYGRLWAADVYPGIDLTFHGSTGTLEYDFRVSPGADPSRIRLRPEPAETIALTASGSALLQAGPARVEMHAPVAYQVRQGMREAVEARFTVHGGELGFALGHYDPGLPLVIDPVLVYASLVGGGDSTTKAFGLAVDKHGNTYVTGSTCAADFPGTAGGFDTQGGAALVATACEDVYVSKLNADGSGLVYSTFLRGKDIDEAFRIAVDAAGAAYVTGITFSKDFPTTAGAFDRKAQGGTCALLYFSYPCADAFVAKLSPTGRSLIYSTLLGGSRMDLGMGIAVDDAGAAYVAGWTNSPDLPTTPGALQPAYGGGTCAAGAVPCPDAFVAKLLPDGSGLGYLTYLGGHDQDAASGISLDAQGNAIVTGATSSGDFPTTAGVVGPAHSAGTQDDVFVAKLNTNGTRLLFSTLVGGTGTEWPFALAQDSTGAIVVAGATTSTDFPVTAGAYQRHYAGPANAECPLIEDLPACGDAFVLKLSANAKSLLFATYLGGQYDDTAYAVGVDSADRIWITGTSQSADFPQTADAYQATGNGAGFVAQLSANGRQLAYAGGLARRAAQGTDLAIDAADNVYLLGIGSVFGDGGSPATPGAFSAGSTGALVTKLAPRAAPALQLSTTALNLPLQTLYSAGDPKSITVTNTGAATARLDVSLTGQTKPAFLMTNNCPPALAASRSCTITLRAQPSAEGNLYGSVVILSNAPGSPQQVLLSTTGNAVQGGSWVPDRLAFADQQAGTTGPTVNAQLVLQTTTSFPEVESVRVGGPNAADFSLDLSNCAVGNAYCSVGAAFAPAGGATGTRRATVTVSADAYGSPYTLALSGTVATGPTLDLTPASLDFGNVAPASTGQIYLTLHNLGAQPLTVTAMLPTLASYSLLTGSCGALPIHIAPQAACNVGVQFQPASSGLFRAALTIDSNTDGGEHSLALTGIGADPAGPQLRVSAAAASFGAVQIGTTYNVPQFFSLSNPGQKAASLSITLPVEFPSNSSYSNCGSSLAAGSSCTIAVGFAPAKAGKRSGKVTIRSNAPGGVRSIVLDGIGVLIPGLVAEPQAVDFGRIGVGVNSAVRTVTLTNPGQVAVDLSSVRASGPFLAVNHCADTLAAGASCAINLRATPTAAGSASGLLVLRNDAAGATQAVMLSVEGVEGPSVQASVASLDFGRQVKGTTSLVRKVVISNTGTADATLTGLAINGDFLQSNTCTGTLPVGASCVASLRFRPSLVTDPIGLVGSLSISGRFPGSPQRVELSGIGSAAEGAAAPPAR